MNWAIALTIFPTFPLLALVSSDSRIETLLEVHTEALEHAVLWK
jgi:hypothetical protein